MNRLDAMLLTHAQQFDGVPAPKLPPRKSVNQRAHELIHGQRETDYGHPAENMRMIAALWGSYLDAPISAHDVTMLLALMKIARARKGYHEDTAIDLAGYAGLSERVREARP